MLACGGTSSSRCLTPSDPSSWVFSGCISHLILRRSLFVSVPNHWPCWSFFWVLSPSSSLILHLQMRVCFCLRFHYFDMYSPSCGMLLSLRRRCCMRHSSGQP